MKINFFDTLIFLVLALSLLSFFFNYTSPRYEFSFSGSQIYKITQQMDYLDSKGFLYTVWVKGFFISDYQEFEEEGFVTATEKGYFLLKLKDGRIYSVGGRMSYSEDVVGEEFVIKQLSKSSVIFRMKSFEATSVKDIFSKIENASSFILYSYEDISCSFILVVEDMKGTLIDEVKLEEEIEREIFFLKNVEVDFFENGAKIKFERVSLKEFLKLEKILHGERFYVTEIQVFYQTSQEILPEDIDVIEGFESDTVYDIHVRV